MKHLKWLYGAMALTLLGGCSDRDLIVDENTQINGQHTNSGKAEGYLAVEIKLPQETMTRAEEEDTGALNDQYSDGTADEYYVDNALIALFKGKTENDAVFMRAQKLTKPFFSNLPADDGISSSYIAAIEVQDVPDEESEETYWALVVLNHNESTTGFGTDDDGNEVLLLGGQKLVAETTPFSAIKNITTTNSFISKNEDNNKTRFFMINAPMSKALAKDATASDITYLTNLGKKVYDTPEEAKSKVSGCVYVERAMSKVTCKSFDKNTLQLTFIGEDGNEVDLSKNGWEVTATVKYALSNTANASYLIRNVDFTSDTHFNWNFNVNGRYRMIGTAGIPALSEPFHDGAKNLYRTYWCRDPHYDNAMVAADKVTVTKVGDFKDLSTVNYCKENTFQVKNQNHNSTTLAIFEVDFNVKNSSKTYSNLYVRDGNNAKIYLTRESAYSDGIARIVKDVNVEKAIQAAVATGKSLPDGFSYRDHLDITIETVKTKELNYLEITDIKLKPGESEDFFDETSAANFDSALAPTKKTLLDGVNAMTDVTIYEGGKSYYTVPIKHFGDYYTPWAKDDTNKGVSTSDVYNGGDDKWNTSDHAQKYLGRYGMVRNNWYELNISKIAALGSSVIPDSNASTSDDTNEDKKYFAVEIHILSWAKRLQNIEF